jgi:hypothetical protein
MEKAFSVQRNGLVYGPFSKQYIQELIAAEKSGCSEGFVFPVSGRALAGCVCRRF